MHLLKPLAIYKSKPQEAGRSVIVQGSRSNYGSVKRFSRGSANDLTADVGGWRLEVAELS
jgi:hypothetical protein